MGVVEGVIWLEQAIYGELRSAEIRPKGYKMGTKFVASAGDANFSSPDHAASRVSARCALFPLVRHGGFIGLVPRTPRGDGECCCRSLDAAPSAGAAVSKTVTGR